MNTEAEKMLADVLHAVARLMKTLEDENAALRAGCPEKVIEILPRKTKEIEEVDQLLKHFGEAGGSKQQIEEVLSPFGKLIKENQSLLECSVEAQTQFIQLVFSNAEDEGPKGYSATGGYAMTSAQGEALTLRSDI